MSSKLEAATATNRRLESEGPEVTRLLKTFNEPQNGQGNRTNLQGLRHGKHSGLAALLGLLATDAIYGIRTETLATRRAVMGGNVVPQAPRKSFADLFIATFDDGTLQILMVAAVVSLAIGIYDDPTAGYVEGCAILAAIFVVSLVTAANDYQKESQFRQLSAAVDEAADVVVRRGDVYWQIAVQEIVVGDLVSLETGDAVPCDGVLVQADQLTVDESALTGEPEEVEKTADGDCFVLSGCTVEGGAGQFIATAVGRSSQWGIIQSKLEKEQEQTPLQEKLDDMAALIGYVGMGAASATFLAMMMIKIMVQPAHLADTSVFSYALDAFIMAVTIVVVAVPEGLPLAVTISLAFSTRQMLADQNLIRHLAACETMGNATNICSDKTGTLTQNRMTVLKGIFADTRCDDTVHRVPTLISTKALEFILEGIACCSTARIVANQQEDDNNVIKPPTIIGNKTEGALLLLAQSAWSFNDDTEARREAARFGQTDGSRVLMPFSSARKSMTVLVNKVEAEHEDTLMSPSRATRSSSRKGLGEDWTLYHKGAAELVLDICSHYLDIDGNEAVLTSEKREEFREMITDFSSQALRCVALAHRSKVQELHRVNPATITAQEAIKLKLESGLCLDAIAAIMDPLRPDVIEAVATCQKAGIFVRMVTGDNLDTATAIAKQAGILTEGTYGATFGRLHDPTN
jgi:calcium-translocating P-type ATPase